MVVHLLVEMIGEHADILKLHPDGDIGLSNGSFNECSVDDLQAPFCNAKIVSGFCRGQLLTDIDSNDQFSPVFFSDLHWKGA